MVRNPKWSVLTTFSVNLLSLAQHRHGEQGRSYYAHDDVVALLHRVLTEEALDDA